ncbi:MAG: PH domain-containing protein [Proteobacteria bacterium]|nr:PH domain-containing protein [Pseudomonadota bacterium]
MEELRPTIGPFLFGRVSSGVVVAALVFALLAGAGLVTDMFGLMALGGLLAVALVAWSAVGGFVAWKKERYEIHEHHLVARGGGLLSDRVTELDVRNVTHVKQHLSWLRYKLFDVGDVIVQSAGSSSAEVVFRSVKQPDELYARIRELMRHNGFSLQAREKLHSETPSSLGAALEVGQMGLGALGLLGGASALSAGLAAAGPVGVVLGLLGMGSLVALAGVWLVLHYLDMKRRTYEVYDDVVEYREGFLSRTNAFIPNENIADAATRQTFIDQALGIWDVRVSCQGSGSEVAFRRLADGPALQAVIRDRVASAQDQRQAEAVVEVPGDRPRASRPAAAPVPASEAWTAQLKMNTLRATLSGGLIRALATTFTVGPASLSSTYSFLGRQELEFAYDKVTGVQVSTGPLDHLFGTFSVKIWSIGSSTPITLAHVERSDVDLPALLRQCGIVGGEAQLDLPATFSFGTFARAHAVGAVFWLPLVLVTFGLLAIPLGLVAVWAAARAKRQAFRLHEHHIELEQGVFFRTHTYARYDDIKKVSVQRYAGIDAGKVTFFVAGETQIQTSKGPGPVIPNSFTAHYMPDVRPFITSLDALLQGRIQPQTAGTALAVADGPSFQPAVANTLVKLGVFGCLFPPLWLFIPWSWMALKRRHYRVEAERVVVDEGVIYKTHTSVLFDRIDSLKQGQAMFGKMFDNGGVTLFTAGSSLPDLVLSDVPEFAALYGAIRERYGS